MRVEGKIVGFELFGGLGVGGVVQQDGAENGFFGFDVGGQAGVESQVGKGGHIEESRRTRGPAGRTPAEEIEEKPSPSAAHRAQGLPQGRGILGICLKTCFGGKGASFIEGYGL